MGGPAAAGKTPGAGNRIRGFSYRKDKMTVRTFRRLRAGLSHPMRRERGHSLSAAGIGIRRANRHLGEAVVRQRHCAGRENTAPVPTAGHRSHSGARPGLRTRPWSGMTEARKVFREATIHAALVPGSGRGSVWKTGLLTRKVPFRRTGRPSARCRAAADRLGASHKPGDGPFRSRVPGGHPCRLRDRARGTTEGPYAKEAPSQAPLRSPHTGNAAYGVTIFQPSRIVPQRRRYSTTAFR